MIGAELLGVGCLWVLGVLVFWFSSVLVLLVEHIIVCAEVKHVLEIRRSNLDELLYVDALLFRGKVVNVMFNCGKFWWQAVDEVITHVLVGDECLVLHTVFDVRLFCN